MHLEQGGSSDAMEVQAGPLSVASLARAIERSGEVYLETDKLADIGIDQLARSARASGHSASKSAAAAPPGPHRAAARSQKAVGGIRLVADQARALSQPARARALPVRAASWRL